MGNGFAVSAYYVGSLNRKSPLYNDINGPQFNITAAGTSGASCTDLTKACGYANTSATVNNRRPLNAQFGASGGGSDLQQCVYHSLQPELQLQRPAGHAGAASHAPHQRKGYYTWSKTLQSNTLDSTGGLNGTFVDANYPQLEYRQRSDQDRRHMMTMSFVWKPDYFDQLQPLRADRAEWLDSDGHLDGEQRSALHRDHRQRQLLLGPWQQSPKHHSRQDVRTRSSTHSRVAEMAQWFDTSAYCSPRVDAGCPGVGPLGLLGNERPAQLDDPGYRNVDASLFRTFNIHESLAFQIPRRGLQRLQPREPGYSIGCDEQRDLWAGHRQRRLHSESSRLAVASCFRFRSMVLEQAA